MVLYAVRKCDKYMEVTARIIIFIKDKIEEQHPVYTHTTDTHTHLHAPKHTLNKHAHRTSYLYKKLVSSANLKRLLELFLATPFNTIILYKLSNSGNGVTGIE